MNYHSPNDSEQAYNDRLDRAERNRRNAEHSTGPTSTAGKNISKLNAVKTGLTGRTVLLPTDNVAHYERHVQNWFADFNPQTPREEYLTQSIADTEWRLERIVQIESSLYAMGRVRFEADLRNNMADDVPEALLPTLLDGHVYMFYEKQFRNLSLQETRLRRQRKEDERKLRELQDERKQEEAKLPKQDGNNAGKARKRTATPEIDQTSLRSGFVFSSEQSHSGRNGITADHAVSSPESEPETNHK